MISTHRSSWPKQGFWLKSHSFGNLNASLERPLAVLQPAVRKGKKTRQEIWSDKCKGEGETEVGHGDTRRAKGDETKTSRRRYKQFGTYVPGPPSKHSRVSLHFLCDEAVWCAERCPPLWDHVSSLALQRRCICSWLSRDSVFMFASFQIADFVINTRTTTLRSSMRPSTIFNSSFNAALQIPRSSLLPDCHNQQC